MNKKLKLSIGFVIILLAFYGCSKNTFSAGSEKSLLDQNWGKSYQQAKQQQILHPENGKNLAPVEGQDAKAAGIVYENYLKSFQEKTQETQEKTQ